MSDEQLELDIGGNPDEYDYCRGGTNTEDAFDNHFQHNQKSIDSSYGNCDNDNDYDVSNNGNYGNDEEDDDDSPIDYENGIVYDGSDNAPIMPDAFYNKVENFLKMPAPKLNSYDNRKKKKKSISSGNSNGNSYGSSGNNNNSNSAIGNIDQFVSNVNSYHNKSEPILPRIISKKEEMESLPPRISSKGNSTKKTVNTAKINSNNVVTKAKRDATIEKNNVLLKEAFEYTDRLLREAIIEESQKDNVNHTSNSKQSKSAPTSQQIKQAQSVYSNTANHHGSHHSSSTGGLVKKLRAKTQSSGYGDSSNRKTSNGQKSNKQIVKQAQPINNGDFDLSKDAEQSTKKNALDFDGLVNNFTTGATLEKLRRELAQSQKSMKKSEDYFMQLSEEFMGKF